MFLCTLRSICRDGSKEGSVAAGPLDLSTFLPAAKMSEKELQNLMLCVYSLMMSLQ